LKKPQYQKDTTAMELLTKERQQGNAKNTQSQRKLQAHLRQAVRTIERLRETIRVQAKREKKSHEKIEQLTIDAERLRMQQQEQRKTTEQADQLASFCNEMNLPNHSFGARMITLCVNLSRQMSFRLIPKTLKLVFETLGLSVACPSHDAIEHWCKRIGLDQINRSGDWCKEGIWIVDHSNQIGQEKVLVILGMPASKLPPPGQTLTLDQLDVLAIVPGKNWKRDDVRAVYREVAERCGTPRFVVCDGAVELRESVDVLQKPGKSVVVLRDFKHFAANRFEKLVGESERFKLFCSAMGTTRCQVQQTELAHLTPPSLKTKARFMNIEPVVRWAGLILFLLENPDHDAAGEVERSRLCKKFGWVASYRDEIASWARCCDLIDRSLGWVNSQGLNSRGGEELEAFLDSSGAWDEHSAEGRLRNALIDFVGCSAAQLKPGERCWQSSESIESAFGRYKCREFQHSRSGFTGLIVSLPTLLRRWTPDEVRGSLSRVKTKDVRAWIDNKIGQTVSGRRTRAYRIFQNASKTMKSAT
jgi:hypothetical protein